MTDTIKQFQGFAGDNYPNFFYSDHPQFQAFLDAYFEWLEKDNTEESKGAKDIFKSLPNAAALINHAPEYRDVDLSIRQFLQYFKKEVLPFKIENPSVPDAFLVKKMREIYLSKGTLKSFELLFKLLYNEDIEAYETRDFILEASEGNYQSTIVCYFKVTGRISDYDNIDFSLSGIYDSENGAQKVTILSTTPVGYVDSDNKILFLAQLAIEADLKIGSNFIIKNENTPGFYVEVETVPSLSEINVTNSAGFSETDVVIIKTKTTGKSTTAIITTESGPITHLFVRNRGYNYNVGDEIIFSVDDISKGDGATAKITKVDNQGRILEIDGVPLRTGENNNGILTNNFEDGIVRVVSQGRYKEFPSIEIRNTNNILLAQPYGGSETGGFGAQISSWSKNVGSIKSINTLAAGAFEDSDDVVVVSPTFVRLQNVDGTIDTGNDVVVQQFMPDSEAMLKDSETVIITIQLNDISSFSKTYRIPYGFDSENWTWLSKEYTFGPDSDGFVCIEDDWDSDNLRVKKNELTKVSFDSDKIVLKMEGELTWAMDNFHWEQLETFKTDDSEFVFSYVTTQGNPRVSERNTSGYWRTTQYYGEVYRTSNGDQLFLLPVGEKPFATSQIIKDLSEPRNTILRLCRVNPNTGDPIFDNNLALGNIIIQWEKPEFDFRLNSVWKTDKRFIDDAGFLNSPSGGVLQDSYIYSYFTYLIQTVLPVGKWRKIVKDTLHPAGMIMVSELKMASEAQVVPNFEVKSEVGFYKQTSVFDAAQDYAGTYRAPASAVSQFYADNVDYSVDAPNAYDEINVNGQVILADHQASVESTIFNTYKGNSWWDYEPVGLVRKEQINPLATQAVLNWTTDFLDRKTTTQNQLSDSEFVSRELIYYEKYDGTQQDLYKTNSRFGNERRGIVRTIVTDGYYNTYDSEFEPYRFARFSDSDSEVVRGFEYSRLEKQVGEQRRFKSTTTKRILDLQNDYENDLQAAMRENKSLSFYNDSDATTYYDYDAFEFKWNRYNSKRVETGSHISQWEVVGYTSWLQNRGTHDRGQPRPESWTTGPRYSNIKTPYRQTSWYIPGDSDNIIFTNSYVPPINTKVVTTVEFDDYPQNVNTTYRDPHNSMRGRRGN